MSCRKRCLYESSIPGCSRMNLLSSTFTKVAWSSILILCFIGFVVHTSIMVYRHTLKHTVTHTMIHSNDFIFPDVTICNSFPYNYHRTENPNISINGKELTGQRLLNQIKNFWKSALKIDIDQLNEHTAKDNLQTRMSLDRFSAFFDFGHHLDEIILECKYHGEKCDMKAFVKGIYPFYQNCWTFRPAHRVALNPGLNSGLSLLLHVNDRRAFLSDEEILDWLRGVTVTIHQPNTMPQPVESHMIASAGSHTLIEVDSTRYLRLYSNNNPCVKNEENLTTSVLHLDYTRQPVILESLEPAIFEYHQDSCSQIDRQRDFVEDCGCFSETLPVFADILPPKETYTTLFCHELDLEMITEANYTISKQLEVMVQEQSLSAVVFDSWRQQSVKRILKQIECHIDTVHQHLNKPAHSAGSCTPRCDSLTYFTSVMSYVWPESVKNAESPLRKMMQSKMDVMEDPITYSRTLEKHLDDLVELQDTFLKLDVYPKSNKGSLIEESLEYPFTELFSDFGGILSLWLGMSIIKIIEIVCTSCVANGDGKVRQTRIEDEKKEISKRHGSVVTINK